MVRMVIAINDNNELAIAGFPTNEAKDITTALGILERAKEKLWEWHREEKDKLVKLANTMPPPSKLVN